MAFMEEGSGCDMADGRRQVRRPLLGFVCTQHLPTPLTFNTSSGRARRTVRKLTTELEQIYLKRRAGVAGKAG